MYTCVRVLFVLFVNRHENGHLISAPLVHTQHAREAIEINRITKQLLIMYTRNNMVARL